MPQKPQTKQNPKVRTPLTSPEKIILILANIILFLFTLVLLSSLPATTQITTSGFFAILILLTSPFLLIPWLILSITNLLKQKQNTKQRAIILCSAPVFTTLATLSFFITSGKALFLTILLSCAANIITDILFYSTYKAQNNR